MELRDDRYCFACGRENPIGLRLSFQMEAGKASTEFVPQRGHQGYAGLAHGGIIGTVLDEAMARLLIESGYTALTARIRIRFRRPLQTHERILVSAEIEKVRGHLVQATSRAILTDGTSVAEARATFVLVK